MKHIIRIQLEHKTDVIREIEIPSNKSLIDLHYAIIKALALDKNEIASFYITNEQFELLQEIPLFKIDEQNELMFDMSNITIKSAFQEINSQLIYIYDFLKMWRFLVSNLEKKEIKSETIKVINTIGEMPKEAPEIFFETEKEVNFFKQANGELEDDFEKLNESEY